MKKILIYICVILLVTSCTKGKITDIKITSKENKKTYKSYIKKNGLDIDSEMLADDCPWIDNPKDNLLNVKINRYNNFFLLYRCI